MPKNPAAEKLLIPLPIPHPVHIAIAIHNRDSEQPIPLDSEICWDILKAVEECNGDIQVSTLSLYRRVSSIPWLKFISYLVNTIH